MTEHIPAMWDESFSPSSSSVNLSSIENLSVDTTHSRYCDNCSAEKNFERKKAIVEGNKVVRIRCCKCGEIIEEVSNRRRNDWKGVWNE